MHANCVKQQEVRPVRVELEDLGRIAICVLEEVLRFGNISLYELRAGTLGACTSCARDAGHARVHQKAAKNSVRGAGEGMDADGVGVFEEEVDSKLKLSCPGIELGERQMKLGFHSDTTYLA
jgi:hypothetical protein